MEEEGAPQCGDVLVLRLWLNVKPVRFLSVPPGACVACVMGLEIRLAEIEGVAMCCAAVPQRHRPGSRRASRISAVPAGCKSRRAGLEAFIKP